MKKGDRPVECASAPGLEILHERASSTGVSMLFGAYSGNSESEFLLCWECGQESLLGPRGEQCGDDERECVCCSWNSEHFVQSYPNPQLAQAHEEDRSFSCCTHGNERRVGRELVGEEPQAVDRLAVQCVRPVKLGHEAVRKRADDQVATTGIP